MASLRKIAGCVLAAGMAASVLSGAARAEEDKLGYSWTITGASDYLFRGISFTNNSPTVNSYVELTYAKFYLGFWTSNIGEGDVGLGPWEQDVYAGYRTTTGPINWDIGALYYFYMTRGSSDANAVVGYGPVGPSDLDYFEFQVATTTSPITNLTLGLKGYYTPDQDLAITETGTVELSAYYTLPNWGTLTPTIGGLVGYSESDKNVLYPTGYFLGDDAYTYWNAGVKLTVEKFFMDLRYWDTTIEAADPGNNRLADERFLFSAGVALP